MKKIIFIFVTTLIFSCTPRKAVVYYQNIDSLASSSTAASYEIKVQPDDLLSIIVSAEDPEIAVPFNLRTISTVRPNEQELNSGKETMQLYLVDASGFIDFPVLGKLKVSGRTRTQITASFQDKISAYINNPIINFRITNFKISVQGEVNAPGTYAVDSERITLIEALTKAGDLTIYGKRNNILIIRDQAGVKTFNKIDITKADFINSPFYYLAQNDVVYVEPNKARINAASVGPNTGVIISVTSLIITLITLILR